MAVRRKERGERKREKARDGGGENYRLVYRFRPREERRLARDIFAFENLHPLFFISLSFTISTVSKRDKLERDLSMLDD